MKRIIAVIVVLAVAAGAAWLAMFSGVFVVRHVEVSGTSLLTVDQVTAAASIDPATQIVRLDAAAVADRIRQLPQVADVEVRRVPFDRVSILVTERVAVAVVASPGGYQLIDATGTPFVDAASRPDTLPLLPSRTDSVGDVTALAVAAALGSDIRAQVDSISATTRDDATLRLRSGATVRWGSADRSELKSTVLLALLPTRAAVYDVTAPEVPTTTGART